jgi:hypothetical protein
VRGRGEEKRECRRVAVLWGGQIFVGRPFLSAFCKVRGLSPALRPEQVRLRYARGATRSLIGRSDKTKLAGTKTRRRAVQSFSQVNEQTIPCSVLLLFSDHDGDVPRWITRMSPYDVILFWKHR